MSSKITVRGIVFSAIFAALMTVLSFAQVNLGFSPVPITLGNLTVMLAGAVLGGGYGFFSMLLVVILTTLGLPMLHGSGGLGVMLGPTGGYVWMYPLCALFTGLWVSRVKGKGVVAFLQIFLASYIFGALLCYVGGVSWLMHVTHMPFQKAMISGCYPFLIGDAIKAVVTAIVVLPIRNVYPASRLVGTGGSKVAEFDDVF